MQKLLQNLARRSMTGARTIGHQLGEWENFGAV